MPADETTPVTAVVSGKLPDGVQLQYRDHGSDERQSMHAQDNHKYAINVPVGSEPIEYRIHAGNSVTRWHTLDPKQRPSITTFQKTIHHPDYAELDDSARTEASGDVEALEGSTAEIEWIASAPLSSAKLSVQWDGSDPEPWKLQQLESNRYRMRLPIDCAGIYKIALVDAETGFDNPFLPAYRIHSVEDLPPRIELVDMPRESILLPANDLLPFEMRARDELPLAMVGYEVAINEGEWQRQPLDHSHDTGDSLASDKDALFTDLKVVTFAHELDLLPYNLNVGDSVRLRGVAVDRKGQSGHTSELEVVIDSDRYSPGTRDTVLDRLAWATAVQEWATAVQKASETTTEQLESLLEDTPEDQVQLVGNIDTSPLEATIEQCEQVIRQSIRQLPNTQDPIAAAQLEHVGRMVDVVQADLREWAASLNGAIPPPEGSGKPSQLKQSMHRSADSAKRTEAHVSHFIGFDLTLAYTADIYGLAGFLDSFQPASAERSPWRRLYRYSTVMANRLKAFDKFVADTAVYLPKRSQKLATNLRKWLGDRLYRLNELLDETTETDAGGKEDALRKLLVDLRRELGDKTNTASQDGQIHQKTVDGLRDLDRRSGALHQEIASLGDKLQDVAKAQEAVLASKDATEIGQIKSELDRVSMDAKRAASDLPVRLRRWATLHQLRPDADARYAADAGLASRAIETVLKLSDGSSELQNAEQEPATHSEIVKAIASDYQILEAGHRLTEIVEHLEPLIQAERWSRNRVVRRFELPLRWDTHLKSVEDAATALRDAKIDSQIYGPVDRSRWETPQNVISQALSERRWNREADLPVFRQMQDVHDKLASPQKELQPIMEAARQRIAAYVPSIPQLAEDAADSLQQQVAGSSPAPESPTDDSPSPDDAAVSEAETVANEPQSEAAEEAFQKQMQRLIDALVQHANLADVSTFDGLQQARDADAAVDVLKASQDDLERAQAEAAAQKSKAKAQELALSPELQSIDQELSEAQQRTLDLLKTVQQHFARGAEANRQQPQETAQTDDMLLAAVREAGLQRQTDQRFEAIEQMVEASQKSPQDLLRELEAELQRNPQMQNALSDISQSAVEGVRETLSRAANQQESMQRGIESADQEFRNAKKPIVQALSEVADRVSEMERTLVQQAEKSASRGEIAEIHQQLREQRQQLGEIAAQARRPNDDTLMADLQRTAEQVAASLGEVARQIKSASEDAAALQDSAAEEDEGKRRSLAKSLQDETRRMRDRRIRDAENRLRDVQQEVRRAEQKLRGEENKRQSIENQVRQAEQKLKQNPDSDQLKRALEQTIAQQQQAQQQVDQAGAAEQVAKEKRGRYEEAVAAAKATPQPDLNAANPAAQSAGELAAHAAEATDKLSQAARQAAEAADTDTAPAPPDRHLQNAETQQRTVHQQVDDAARDLARAARHERRLNKQAPAELLSAQSQKIAQTGRDDVATAEERLDNARAAATQRQQATDADNSGSANQPPQDQNEAESKARRSAAAARDALQKSEQALRQREQEMEPLVGAGISEHMPAGSAPSDSQAASSDSQTATSGSPAASSSTTASPSDSQAASSNPQPGDSPTQGPAGESSANQHPTVAGLQDPDVMAQTLDQLDQQIAAASQQQLGGQAENDSSSPGEPSSGVPQAFDLPGSFASRLESEARAQGRQLAQQRTAGQTPSQAQSQQPSDSTSELVSNGAGPGSLEGPAERLQRADRHGNNDWGALETQTIDDAADSGTDPLNRVYRSQLEAYFRVLAERSRGNSSSVEGS
ncbi:MAG: hypothetical protein WD119_02460 [Pirellulaceae bacterium]